MRDFLDDIFSFIGSESLSDEEFEATGFAEDDVEEYSLEVYNALKTTLEGRENVSGQQLKLRSYFIAKGTSLEDDSEVIPKSNILIGSAL